MPKTLFIALTTSVLMTTVNATVRAQLCQPEGAVITVTPCQETKAGTITVSSNGEYSSSAGSGPEKTWQFKLNTWASWKNPTTEQSYQLTGITVDRTLNCGEKVTYEQPLNYYSPAFPDWTYAANGSIHARDLSNFGDWELIGSKSCDYTVDNP